MLHSLADSIAHRDERIRKSLRRPAVLVIMAGLIGCSVPPPPSPAPAPAPRPAPPVVAAPTPPPPAPYTTEADWRRVLAQHILRVNRDRVFDGRPPHPLKAIVVLELTVGADGKLQRASVLRVPGHAKELGAEAVRTVQAASPVPPPPRALLGRRRGAVHRNLAVPVRQPVPAADAGADADHRVADSCFGPAARRVNRTNA
jgi:periplasmic protein TonB